MAFLLFFLAAVVFFLIGADIVTTLDVVWGFFLLALGLCAGGTSFGSIDFWRNRR